MPELDARDGRWYRTRIQTVRRIRQELGAVNIIAEDLGISDVGMHNCGRCAFSGHEVLQFGFDHKADSEYAS